MIDLDRLVVPDTSVLVLLARDGPVRERIDKDLGLAGRTERPLVSFVTLAEAESLARKFGWGRDKIRRLRDLFSNLVVVNIHQGDILREYVTLDRATEEAGNRMGKHDLWIAATSVAVNAVLITMDRDFDYLASESRLDRILLDPRSGSVLAD